MIKRPASEGFSLVLVLIMSTALLILGAALLQTVDLLRTSSLSSYYSRAATTAAEAGTEYAEACLIKHNYTKTWGAALTPDKNCSGSGVSVSPYLTDNAQYRSTFSVGSLDYQDSSTVLISSTGTVQTKNTSGSVVKTHTQIVKKKITWNTSTVSSVSSSSERACGVIRSTVYCWGKNDLGQLGNGKIGNGLSGTDYSDTVVTPVEVYRSSAQLGSKKAASVVSGFNHSCLLTTTHDVYCWGQNQNGQLGQGSVSAYSNSPLKVSFSGVMNSGEYTTKLGSAYGTTCALSNQSNLYCWGDNAKGTLGNGTTGASSSSPIRIGGPSGGYGGLIGKAVSDISYGANNAHFCAIAVGSAYCWGENLQGQLGDGTQTDRNIPTAVNTAGVLSGKTVTKVSTEGASADAHTCVIASGKAYCWGSNSNGQIGSGGSTGGVYQTPQAVSTSGVLSGKTVTEIATSALGSCTIASSRAYCWGAPITLGYAASASTQTSPVTVDNAAVVDSGIFASSTVSNLSGGGSRICASVMRKYYCWGTNTYGQIGDGTTSASRMLPTESLPMRTINSDYVF